MVLSAGLGTRLRPLTDEIPKPLVPVGDQPLLGVSLQKLAEAGARRLIVNVHHHAGQIEKYLEGLPLEVHVSREERILGTAGGIAAVRKLVDCGPLVIVNGDIVGDLPLREIVGAADAGLVMALVSTQNGQGTVGLDEAGNVARLRGESFGREVASGDYMGVAALGADCLARLPQEGCLVGDWALPHLRAGGQVRTLVFQRRFEDIGTPEDYLTANLGWLRQRQSAAAESYLGPDVRVSEGVEVIQSVVGAGAQITGSGRVVASLILPRAHATAPLTGAIVTPSGRVMSVQEGQG